MFAKYLAGCALGLLGLVHFLGGGQALAQLPVPVPPRIVYVSPMGGQAGSTIEVTVTGQDIEDADGLYFSFPGAKVELSGGSEKVKPMVDPKGKGKGAVKPGAQLSQKFKVTIPANAPLGIHDIRIVTKGGVSNSRAFVVGDLKEVNEQEPNDDLPKAQKIDLGTTINGLVPTGTDVDYYQFGGKKGQRVVISCLTTSIDSKLPAQVQLYGPIDIKGTKESYLAFSKGYQANDTLLDTVLPHDGDYYVRLCSFTYLQGGPDYFYRLSISTAPWVDAIFPPVIEPGKDTKVTIYGRNLPGGVADPASMEDGRMLEKASVTIKAPQDPQAAHRLEFRGFVPPPMGLLDGFEYRLKNDAGSSNNVVIGLARAPIVLDNMDNDTSEKAQKVNLPCEIAGMVEKKGDRDWYAFSATKGQVISIEAFGDRLGSPTDLYFELYDEKGTKVTEQDENPDITVNHFYTRSDDPSRYRLTAPADGDYKLLVASRYSFAQAGPRQVYLVRLGAEETDFHLVGIGTSPLVPETAVVGQAGNQVYSVLVFRHGKFTGDITLSGDNLPPGVTVRPQVISSTQKQANLVISAAAEAPPFTGAIKVVGTAVVDGKKLVRDMRGASITWPVAQVAPTISRLDRELVLAVRDKGLYTIVAEKDKIDVSQGDKVNIPVKLNRLSDLFKETVTVLVLNPPQGLIQTQPLTLAPGKDSGSIVLEIKGTVTPGNFTLVVRGQTQAPGMKPNPKVPPPANNLQAAGPISLTVVPKSLGKLSVNPPTAKVAAGKEVEVVVKIARLFDYNGPFKVEVIDGKGLKAPDAVIPAGQDEAKLVITAAGVTAGANPMITIRATAMFNNTVAVVHETKLNLAITK